MIAYFLYRLGAFVANHIPRSLGNWMSLRIADCNYFLNKTSRDSTRANLKVILGEDASEAHRYYALRWVFRSFGKYFFEFIGNKRFNADFFDRCVTFIGTEHIEAARQAGHGAVLISAHLGNWELGAAAMSFRGTPVLSIIQKHPNPRIHEYYIRQRAHRNYQAVYVGEAARPILRHLKNNGVVAVLGERPYGEDGVKIRFFGHEVTFASGPARLALTSRAPLIPGFVLRRWDDSFRIFFRDPIVPPEGLSKEEKIRHMTQKFAEQLEELVRENATQWPTFYRVFEGSGLPEQRGI
jgi:lauroyl/myristoyl acyltransferase